MRKLFFTFALAVMCVCASAQTNQMFWFNGQLMFGSTIAQTDSIVFSNDASALDTLHLLLPRTATKVRRDTIYVQNTIYVHDTVSVHDTVYVNKCIEGTLSGAFSIADGTQIHFSQGNLQYQASTNTWQFAENQYDMIGEDNQYISSTYDGWIDLFGWGTGDNPTRKSTSYTYYTSFTDWGINAISNGGNEANLWRTLTKNEWVYLFVTRTNAASLFGLGSVNGINGTIILPDNWITPQSVSFTPSPTQGMAYDEEDGYYYDRNKNHFNDNTYTAEQWSVMEKNGAVFLPAAGIRSHTDVGSVNSGGYYWSATSNGEANDPGFSSNGLYPQDYTYGSYGGHSVRLVR